MVWKLILEDWLKGASREAMAQMMEKQLQNLKDGSWWNMTILRQNAHTLAIITKELKAQSKHRKSFKELIIECEEMIQSLNDKYTHKDMDLSKDMA